MILNTLRRVGLTVDAEELVVAIVVILQDTNYQPNAQKNTIAVSLRYRFHYLRLRTDKHHHVGPYRFHTSLRAADKFL